MIAPEDAEDTCGRQLWSDLICKLLPATMHNIVSNIWSSILRKRIKCGSFEAIRVPSKSGLLQSVTDFHNDEFVIASVKNKYMLPAKWLPSSVSKLCCVYTSNGKELQSPSMSVALKEYSSSPLLVLLSVENTIETDGINRADLSVDEPGNFLLSATTFGGFSQKGLRWINTPGILFNPRTQKSQDKQNIQFVWKYNEETSCVEKTESRGVPYTSLFMGPNFSNNFYVMGGIGPLSSMTVLLPDNTLAQNRFESVQRCVTQIRVFKAC